MLPRISIFDRKWNLVEQNLARIKKNPLTGNLEAEMELGKLSLGKYLMVVEADNRSGKKGIGEYAQSTYAVVPIITTVDMYSLPTGKARLTLKK